MTEEQIRQLSARLIEQIRDARNHHAELPRLQRHYNEHIVVPERFMSGRIRNSRATRQVVTAIATVYDANGNLIARATGYHYGDNTVHAEHDAVRQLLLDVPRFEGEGARYMFVATTRAPCGAHEQSANCQLLLARFAHDHGLELRVLQDQPSTLALEPILGQNIPWQSIHELRYNPALNTPEEFVVVPGVATGYHAPRVAAQRLRGERTADGRVSLVQNMAAIWALLPDVYQLVYNRELPSLSQYQLDLAIYLFRHVMLNRDRLAIPGAETRSLATPQQAFFGVYRHLMEESFRRESGASAGTEAHFETRNPAIAANRGHGGPTPFQRHLAQLESEMLWVSAVAAAIGIAWGAAPAALATLARSSSQGGGSASVTTGVRVAADVAAEALVTDSSAAGTTAAAQAAESAAAESAAATSEAAATRAASLPRPKHQALPRGVGSFNNRTQVPVVDSPSQSSQDQSALFDPQSQAGSSASQLEVESRTDRAIEGYQTADELRGVGQHAPVGGGAAIDHGPAPAPNSSGASGRISHPSNQTPDDLNPDIDVWRVPQQHRSDPASRPGSDLSPDLTPAELAMQRALLDLAHDLRQHEESQQSLPLGGQHDSIVYVHENTTGYPSPTIPYQFYDVPGTGIPTLDEPRVVSPSQSDPGVTQIPAGDAPANPSQVQSAPSGQQSQGASSASPLEVMSAADRAIEGYQTADELRSVGQPSRLEPNADSEHQVAMSGLHPDTESIANEQHAQQNADVGTAAERVLLFRYDPVHGYRVPVWNDETGWVSGTREDQAAIDAQAQGMPAIGIEPHTIDSTDAGHEAVDALHPDSVGEPSDHTPTGTAPRQPEIPPPPSHRMHNEHDRSSDTTSSLIQDMSPSFTDASQWDHDAGMTFSVEEIEGIDLDELSPPAVEHLANYDLADGNLNQPTMETPDHSHLLSMEQNSPQQSTSEDDHTAASGDDFDERDTWGSTEDDYSLDPSQLASDVGQANGPTDTLVSSISVSDTIEPVEQDFLLDNDADRAGYATGQTDSDPGSHYGSDDIPDDYTDDIV